MSDVMLHKQVWVRSRGWDFFWLLSGIPIGLFLYLLGRLTSEIMGTIAVLLLLWGGHIISPMVLAWSHTDYRKLMIANKFKFVFRPALHIVVCTVLGVLTGYGLTSVGLAQGFLPKSTTSADVINALLFLTWVGFIWNMYHFSAQNFGVLALYRAKSRAFPEKQRSLDRWFCTASMLFLVPVALYAAQHIFITPLKMYYNPPSDSLVTVLKIFTCAASIVLTSGMLALELRNSFRSVGRLISIVTVGLAPAALALDNLLFLGMYAGAHYLAAIGLASLVYHNHQVNKLGSTRWMNSFVFLGTIAVVASIALSYILQAASDLDRSTDFLVTPAKGSILLCGLVGFRFGLGHVHFLYDRWLYKFSDPNVRVTIGKDLFGGPDNSRQKPAAVQAR